MNEDSILSTVAAIIQNETGIIIDKERFIDLEIVIHSRLVFHNLKPIKYIEFIQNNHSEIVFVASCFTIQETSFYRYKAHFDRMKFEVLPELIMRNQNTTKSITILSAGCATGEEPYTIAMILNDLISNISEWNIRIVATDISSNALAIANESLYSEYKLRNIDNWFINRYFTQVKEKNKVLYKLNDNVKRLVTFKQCNLIREPFELADLAGVDIIFCENVMIYFCMESIQRLINNFYNILRPEGHLFLGYSETLNFIKHKFSLSWWNDSFSYKKTGTPEEIISYNIHELNLPEQASDDRWISITENDYEYILTLILKNYHEGLTDNVALLIKKIETNNIKIDERFYIIKAEFILDKKEYINASNECRKAININPQTIDAHIILGSIYMDLEMTESSAFEIQTALYIDNKSILANYYFAIINKQMGKLKEYMNYLNIAHSLLNENNGVLKSRLFPINKKRQIDIYNEILNIKV